MFESKVKAKITTELLGLVGFSHSFGSFDDMKKQQQSSDYRYSHNEEDEQSLFEVFSKILEVIAERLLSPPILHWTKFKQNREFRKATKHLNSVIGGIVKHRLENVTEREEGKANRSTTSSPSSVRSRQNDKDILSVLARPDEDGKRMSYDDIFGNVRMFLLYVTT